MWLLLPKDWIVLNGVVLEPKPDEFIQLDHILVGPPGVYLVETKAWDGAFLAHNDNWKRKQGKRWVRCESPTRQSSGHLRLFLFWISKQLGSKLPEGMAQWIHPNVLFTRAKWLKFLLSMLCWLNWLLPILSKHCYPLFEVLTIPSIQPIAGVILGIAFGVSLIKPDA